MPITISMGHVDHYDERIARFAKQLGLTGVQLHNPVNLDSSAGHWTATDLITLRRRIEADGLTLDGLENVPGDQFLPIIHGTRGRDQALEHYRATIAALGAAGVRLLGYNFLAGYVWRTEMRAAGRGGARVTGFDLDRALSHGNALDYAGLSPAETYPELSATDLRANHEIFLDATLPVAEQHGVRLSLHPDDPPVATPLGGTARIFTSPEALIDLADRYADSPAWCLTLCLGTVSEMGGQAAADAVIDHLGPRGQLGYVHFRDVAGTVPTFSECFLGEGNLDPARTLRRLHRAGFSGFIIDDHVPAMDGDLDTWGDTSPEAYCSRGRAHAIGYLSGVLDALQSEPRS